MSAAQGVVAPCAEADCVGVVEQGPDTCAIVVAGGSGERFGDPRGKQFVELCGLPMAAWSIAAFDRAPSVAQIVVVCAYDKADRMRDEVLGKLSLATPVLLAPGGATRQDSVRSGLEAADARLALAAIHDAARPLIEVEVIEGILAYVRARKEIAGAICASRVTDTIKRVDGASITATLDRTSLWAAQTPQAFWLSAIREAHARAQAADDVGATDDAALIEREGGVVDVYETSRNNIKVTLPEDLASAEAILSERLLG